MRNDLEPRLTRRISLVTAATSGIVAIINVLNMMLFLSMDALATFSHPSVWVLILMAVVFANDRLVPLQMVQRIQTTLFILLSGPTVVSNIYAFFGMWFFVLGLVLFYKYQQYHRWLYGKLILISGYFLSFFITGVVSTEGMTGSALRISEYFIFLLACLAYLYFIFEESIRELLRANHSKDEELLKKEAEIARLVPLSVIGERVAHVAHSFKNNLGLIASARLHLKEGGDPALASARLEEFSRSMYDRIDNILLVRHTGAGQEPEVFDAARVLAGLNQVYLTEPAFLNRAAIELEANEPTPVLAVRWDFLLMAENILKNALEALTAKGGHGTIRITLKDRLLTLANDGGAMEQCSNCRESCLDCSRYGKPGQTTKKTGSGHGLAQVFATCRKYGWTLRIRTRDDWTFFEIGLTATTSA